MSNDGVIVFDPGSSDLGGAEVVGLAGSGWQSLSTLYDYRVLIEVEEEGGFSDDDMDRLLRDPVRIMLGTDTTTEVHGVVSEIEMCSTAPREAVRYWLTIVPRLYYLTLSRHTRVWQGKSHLDIVKLVLEEHGFAEKTHYEVRCKAGDYPSHPYTVQYQETDFDFVSRLLEHNGIHYHFTQQPDTEMLVLGDDNKAFAEIVGQETMVYDGTNRRTFEDEAFVTSLRRFRRPRAAKVRVRDYNWRLPTTPLSSEHDADTRTGHGVFDFFGDHFGTDAAGSRFARLRAEEHVISGDVYSGTTTSRSMLPGSRFVLTGHPNPDLDKAYVVTAIREGVERSEGSTYVKSFEAIPADVVYRPARRVPWPRVDGLVNAKVDGEVRATATPVDAEGRYKLVLPFDERAKTGGKASRWVRAAQPSAGSAYGFHFPLHIGTEVVVGHVNGDPDRPIILGAVPNTETESPVLSDNAMQSRMRTGSGIVIELDDDC